MGYHFEIWLKGFAKDYLRGISDLEENSFHPHLTFFRPFKIISNEDAVIDKAVNFCREFEPIPFSLEGINHFDGKIYYVDVAENERLMLFNDGLEKAISGDVKFDKKLAPMKKFHAKISNNNEDFYCPKIEQYMLRLTGIQDGKIWTSYDFVTGEVLGRGESLDKDRWLGTVDMFTEKYGLIPTLEGFRKIK